MGLIDLDKKITIAINGWHSDFWDFIMYWLSDRFIWIPFYVLLIVLIAVNYKQKTWIILLLVALLITLVDQTTVHMFKNVFERLRPCHDPDVAPFLHLVKGQCGGSYGFVSSHAANTFALATVITYWLKPYYKIFGWIMFVWAALISYSRIYLGVHFLGDVICGTLWGLLLGWFIVWSYKTFFKDINLKFLKKNKTQ